MKKLLFCTIAILLLPIVAISILLLFGKNVFDNPDFWYGYMAYFSTVILSTIAVWQNINAQKVNEKLTKENIYLQEIIVQKTLPIVKVEFLSTQPSATISATGYDPAQKNSFSISRTYNERESRHVVRELCVYIDTAQRKNNFKKEVSFQIRNISDSFIRHIEIESITIKGYKDCFDSISCNNQLEGNGFSDLLALNDTIDVTIAFFTSDPQKVACWDNPLGGVGFTMYLTNTTINGRQFSEFISIDISNNGYNRVSYGETT